MLTEADQNNQRRLSPNTVKRDVDVFLRTYVSQQSTEDALDNSIECPLAELGLIRPSDGSIFHFERQDRRSLPGLIFAYSIADYWSQTAPDQQTISFERILFGPGSPGAAFKLPEEACTRLVEAFPPEVGITYDESAGQKLLVKSKGLVSSPLDVLATYYRVGSE